MGYSATDNTFARPAENLVVTVDLDSATVLAVDDHEVVPLPPRAGNYAPELASDAANFPVISGLRPDVKPIQITQPRGAELHPRRARDPLAELAPDHRVLPA